MVNKRTYIPNNKISFMHSIDKYNSFTSFLLLKLVKTIFVSLVFMFNLEGTFQFTSRKCLLNCYYWWLFFSSSEAMVFYCCCSSGALQFIWLILVVLDKVWRINCISISCLFYSTCDNIGVILCFENVWKLFTISSFVPKIYKQNKLIWNIL